MSSKQRAASQKVKQKLLGAAAAAQKQILDRIQMSRNNNSNSNAAAGAPTPTSQQHRGSGIVTQHSASHSHNVINPQPGSNRISSGSNAPHNRIKTSSALDSMPSALSNHSSGGGAPSSGKRLSTFSSNAPPPPASSSSVHRGSFAPLAEPLKLCFCDPATGEQRELNLHDQRITIGRLKSSTILLGSDPLVSGSHAEINNSVLQDNGSTNGTLYNNKPLAVGERRLLKYKDTIQCGDTELRVERGLPSPNKDKQELSRSKRFPGGSNVVTGSIAAAAIEEEKKDASKDDAETKRENDAESKMTVAELMEHEFDKIIGHESIKKQLRQFNKKVQLDAIRAKAGSGKEKQETKRLYHMIFQGPPGTGKTTMANVVSKIMLKMKLVATDKVVFINNSLELLGSFVGQTPAKVDAKFEEAKGGVLFVDEAYSIIQQGGGRDGGHGSSFGREAIDTIMKHLDPPSCVVILAGYSAPMEDFLKVNEGLARRIPYRYTFEAYTLEQLLAIFHVMAKAKGETLEKEITSERISELLASLPPQLLSTQNAGLINNWLSFAQVERDSRLDLDAAEANPLLASLLSNEDLEQALDRVREMDSSALSN